MGLPAPAGSETRHQEGTMNATTRRLCAIAALACGIAAIAAAVVFLWNNWLPLLGALALLTVAMAAAWYVVTRRGGTRLVASVVAVAAGVGGLPPFVGEPHLRGGGVRGGVPAPPSRPRPGRPPPP